VLSLLAPGLAWEVWTTAALGDRPGSGWRAVSTRARALDPLSWRRNGWADGATAVVLRSGRLTRRAVAVPHARVQSLTVSQGWVQNRLGVATVHVVPAPGPVSPVLAHLEVAEAEHFLAEVAERARTARRRSEPAPASLAPDPAGLVDWTQHPPDLRPPERQ
jgi:putative membrane protein